MAPLGLACDTQADVARFLLFVPIAAQCSDVGVFDVISVHVEDSPLEGSGGLTA